MPQIHRRVYDDARIQQPVRKAAFPDPGRLVDSAADQRQHKG